MFEQDVRIATTDGTADAVVVAPAGDGRWPGVIMLTDTYGLRDAHLQVARRLASEGYTVVLPNLFYRAGRPPFFGAAVDFHNPDTQARALELRSALAPEAIERDAAGYVDFVSHHPLVAPGPLAIVGYCFSGAVAVRIAAAARPDAFAAVASFHGGRLATDDPTSPHLLLPRIAARLYFGHAENDRSMPKEAIDKLERALAERGGVYQSEVYGGAAHGWTVPDHPAFNPAQAERAFTTLTALLADTLKQAPSKRHA